MTNRKLEFGVGLFIVAGFIAFLVLALKVADSSSVGSSETYQLKAKFDNIGGLKVRSPVKVGGVVVGRVSSIALDRTDYVPVVTMDIYQQYNDFPETSSLSILTAGLLGEQYLGLEPGFVDDGIEILAPGSFIEDTKSALVLEELIGQFLFSQNDD
ncbi:outer membrane lipid asymmetry maintenance protein MlaD [Saccharobesus litoralis]|uniref:Outer membrane lipid asymmetry maintenance protein MlaD n=1 Tax=Saccharobesus litoralis TaxID=2172099 RepID=A0A2S0VWT4_9ALTE|nr:outer membrane lipid asymmetry maintenance protein MlaD [Saccharobesus litoralis]AWB68643.1 outer membrane lipid asymmetry maintenance protein MlaD [Saccharobesus litoralis]